ncbi:hypothetical protein Tco_1361602 [Tanacetum coccineum]
MESQVLTAQNYYDLRTCRLKLKYKGANPKLLDQSSNITISASHVRSRGGAIMELSNYAQVAREQTEPEMHLHEVHTRGSNVVSLAINGKSFASLKMGSALSRFRISCAVVDMVFCQLPLWLGACTRMGKGTSWDDVNFIKPHLFWKVIQRQCTIARLQSDVNGVILIRIVIPAKHVRKRVSHKFKKPPLSLNISINYMVESFDL